MNISNKQGAFRTALVALGTACMLFMAATPALAATVTTTVAATNITQTSARLSGSFDIGRGLTNGADTWFQWGTSTAFGQTTALSHTTYSSGTFTADITGLSPNTKYFYRAMANNATSGPAAGATMSFTTSSVKGATVATMSATHTSTTATFTGYYTAGTSALVETEFLWGTTSSNLTNETGYITRSAATGTFTATATNLSPNTQYYFKAVARSTNNGVTSTIYGSVLPFTTDAGSGSSSCVISSFSPSPTTVTSGQSATLSWNTTNCQSVTLSGGIFGTNSTQYGTWATTGALNTPTTYTLRGTATDGTSTTAQTTVGISGGGTSGGSCVISSFYPSPATVAYGNSTTLYWITSGCATLSVTPNLGAVTNGSSSVSTNSIFTPTTYTLTGMDLYGASTTSTAYVNVSSNGNGNAYCSINSFYGTPVTVANGQPSTLYWNTTGCTSVNISGGSLNSYSNLGPTGSLPTGALYSTTTYTLTANGSNSTSQSTTVSVSGGQYPYSYACSDGVDNDGDGLVDFPNDPGCYSQYDTDESNGGSTNGVANVITLPASNIGTGSTRLNGIIMGTGAPVSAYFEYGQTVTLGQTTSLQNVAANGNITFFDTVNVSASRTYYYRAVVQANGMTIRGSIMSFTTAGISANVPIYVNTGFGTEMKPTASGATTASVNGITLDITNKSDKILVGDTVDYTIVYTNGTNKRLTNAVLSLTLPQGMSLVQSTQGRMTSPSTLEVTIGTIDPNASGSIFVQAQASSAISMGNTLVTNGTLSYTYPNGTRDSTIGFVLNHAGGSSFLGGFSLGAGFFPTTVLGWFMTILIILALILIIRRIVKGQDAGHGHGGHH